MVWAVAHGPGMKLNLANLVDTVINTAATHPEYSEAVLLAPNAKEAHCQ
jgi:hypothetical protein